MVGEAVQEKEQLVVKNSLVQYTSYTIYKEVEDRQMKLCKKGALRSLMSNGAGILCFQPKVNFSSKSKLNQQFFLLI